MVPFITPEMAKAGEEARERHLTKIRGNAMTDKDYDACIRWIAENDESGTMDWREMENLVTVCMVAELFSESNKAVAKRVIAERQKIFA